MEYDFAKYLDSVDPGQKYLIQELSGGHINLTVRATKSGTGLQHSCKFPNKSIVLKYAPPYIASIGDTAPFSQRRQLMEARALSKFTPPDGILKDLGADLNIRVPQLLLYDEKEHILAIEDLGDHITLNNLLESLSPERPASENLEIGSYLQSVGLRVGKFFAQLHSKATLEKVLQTSVPDSLMNTFGFDVVLDNFIKPIQGKLQKHGPGPKTAAPKSNEVRYKHLLEDYMRINEPGTQSFVLGDFYPGSILLPRDMNPHEDISVIDWEFSGLGRGPHADMAQFLAHLTVANMSAKADSERAVAARAVSTSLCAAYKRESAAWLGSIVPRALEDPENRKRLEMFRSAMLLYGGEIVDIGCDDDFSGLVVDPAEAAAAGAWYIDMAGGSIDDMVRRHWEGVADKNKNSVLLSLFKIES